MHGGWMVQRRRSSRDADPGRFWRWVVLGVGILAMAVLTALVLLDGGVEPPQVGDRAPDFSLVGAGGPPVALADVLDDHEAVVLVFYRGFF